MDTGFQRARIDPDPGERFVSLRRELGVTSFGLNEIVLEPGQRGRIHRHNASRRRSISCSRGR